jgi:hypothetical protein
MADVSITAANVVAGANAVIQHGIAGATVTAGQPLYRDSSDGRLKLADCDASATTAACVGLALHGASNGQPLAFTADDDDFTVGGTVAVGIYVLSGTAGGIAPVADLAAADYVVFIGAAKSTSKMKVKIVNAGAVVA